MADTKITALTALTAADPASDVLPIVDISDTTMAASGTTKKISINNILGASGTATLASATITGDLTVDTSTLKVDSTLNKVGIGVATLTGLSTLNVAGDVAITSDLVLKNGSGTAQGYIFGSSGINYRVITGQPHVWQESGTDLMRLNSTGLGIGVAPANNKLQVLGNIGLPNSCTASNETSGVFSIDVANLYAAAGAVWRQCSFLLVYSGVDQNLGNSTVLQTIVTLQGLGTWNTISKNDIVGTASVAVSNDTTTGARITVTVPTGNLGSAYVMLIGGMTSTRPSITINP